MSDTTVSHQGVAPPAQRNNNNNRTTTTTTSTATGTPKRKRTRFPDDESTGKTSSSAAADASILRSLALLPAPITSHVSACMPEFKKLKHTELEQTNKLNRLSDENRIPRSAKVDFKLTATKRVQETTEFKALSDTVAFFIDDLHQKLRESILSVARMELKATKNALKKHFFDFTTEISDLLLINNHMDHSSTPTHSNSRTLTMLTIVNSPMLLKHTTVTAETLFTDHHLHTGHPGDALTMETFSTLDTAPVAPLEADMRRILHLAFVQTWDDELAKRVTKETHTSLEKYLRDKKKQEATTNTAMSVDAEPAVDSATIRQLITTEVAKGLKPITASMNKLTQASARSAKNETRGATKSGASSKKKSPPAAASNAPTSSPPAKKAKKSTTTADSPAPKKRSGTDARRNDTKGHDEKKPKTSSKPSTANGNSTKNKRKPSKRRN